MQVTRHGRGSRHLQALLDLHMPGCDGIEATRRIREQTPATQVVVLTTYADDDTIVEALQAGALGYLTKDADRHQIGRALHAAADGQAVLDPQVQQRLVASAASAAKPRTASDELTDRETDVLRLVATANPPSRPTSTASSPRPVRPTGPQPSDTPTTTVT
jgi:DNA-binding NarL/FixJ family response regulator